MGKIWGLNTGERTPRCDVVTQTTFGVVTSIAKLCNTSTVVSNQVRQNCTCPASIAHGFGHSDVADQVIIA